MDEDVKVAKNYNSDGNKRRESIDTDVGHPWAVIIFLLSIVLPYKLQIGTLALNPHRIVILFLLVPFFIKLLLGRSNLIDWCIIIAALWSGVALLANHTLAATLEPFGINILEFLGAYLVARVSIKTPSQYLLMVRTLFVIVLVLVPIAAIESLANLHIAHKVLVGSDMPIYDGERRLGLIRAQTVFVHPILCGVFVATGYGIFWYSVVSRSQRRTILMFSLAGTFFSLSSGAFLAILIQQGIIFWGFVLGNLRRKWFLLLSAVLAAYVIVDIISNRSPFHVLSSYAGFSSQSAYTRILIWEFGTESIRSNPIFGIGMNDWIRPDWMGPSVDNFWLLLAMRYGIVFVVVFAIGLVCLYVRVGSSKIRSDRTRRLRVGYLVSITGILVAGGTVHYWHAMMAFVMFVIGSGVWFISHDEGLSESSQAQRHDQHSETPVLSRFRPKRFSEGRLKLVDRAQ